MGVMKRIAGRKMSGGAIGFKYNKALSFFDTNKITAAVKRGNKKTLSYFGSYVRKAAQWLIKTRKGYSKPGQPPHSHTGLLKKFIFYFHDASADNVIIGPALLKQGAGHPTVPEVLEHGGSRRVKIKGGKSRRAKYQARPFMGPAFESSKSKLLPGIWRASVK